MMWRLIVPLIVAVICVWIVHSAMPKKWQGPVWEEIKNWLQIASAVVGCLFIITAVISVAFN